LQLGTKETECKVADGGCFQVDLGSGAGFDVFLAARKVGSTGRAIGVDMNDDMLAKARLNASKSNITNTTFVKSQITAIDLPDESADVVISNCVINLVPEAEKPQVFSEVLRILKPGGRLAVSDILAKKEFTEKMRQDIALYVGCIAGASKKEAYESWMRKAGFQDITVVDAKSDLNVYTQTEGGEEMLGTGCCENVVQEKTEKTGCCAPKTEAPSCCAPKKEVASCCAPKQEAPSCCVPSVGEGKDDPDVVNAMKTNYKDVNLNEWAGSYKIFAVKPM
jgi:ubiquinone/menaquinone biosynthesis C-methylase UbiE